MFEFDKIIKGIISESLSERADELAGQIFNKIESNEDVDKYDLEVGMDYGFDDDDEDYTFMRRGKHSSHGPFHFKRNKRGGDVAFGEKKIANMKKRIKGQSEEEVEEGNAFTGALSKAKKEGKKSFNVDGKEFEVTEDLGGMGLGMGHDDFEDINLSDDENPRVRAIKKRYMREPEVDQDVDFISGDEEPVNYRIKMDDGDFLDLGESELIDMIEELVTEEKVKDNLKKTGKPAGLVQYDRVSKKDKEQNSKANKESFKKMADYVEKTGSKGKFDSKPVMFPKGNGELAKMDKKAYTPSEYVDDYVDAFAYPGQTNIKFDIKPDDKKIEMYLKGNRLTGNAQVDDEGNPLGNVVPSKLGEKMYKNYEDNLYGAEQSEASYKRQSQPVEVAGEITQKGKLKSKKSSSAAKAQKVLDNVSESISNEKSLLLNEEMENMKKLIGYQYKK